MDELVAGAAAFALLAIVCNAVAWSYEPAELLDVDMDELAGVLALVPAHRLGGLQIAYPA
ncbi:hypothetical protein ABIC10_007299 [Bradyrhizobium sp. S3.2.12]